MPNPVLAESGDPTYAQKDPKIQAEADGLIRQMERIMEFHRWSWAQASVKMRELGFDVKSFTMAKWPERGICTDCESLHALRAFVKAYPVKYLGQDGRGKFKLNRAVEQVKAGLSVAREGNICYLWANSGAGKTFIYRQLIKLAPEMVRVTAYQDMAVIPLLRMIANALGVRVERDMKEQYRVALVERFIEDPAVVIIDEAQFMSNKYMNLLRGIWDEANERRPGCCGIFMVGSVELKDKLSRISWVTKRLALEQLVSRIRWVGVIGGSDDEFAESFVREGLAPHEIDRDAMERILKMHLGNIRTLENYIYLIKKSVMKGEKVSLRLVEGAEKYMSFGLNG